MTASVAGLSAVAPPPRGEEAGALSRRIEVVCACSLDQIGGSLKR